MKARIAVGREEKALLPDAGSELRTGEKEKGKMRTY